MPAGARWGAGRRERQRAASLVCETMMGFDKGAAMDAAGETSDVE